MKHWDEIDNKKRMGTELTVDVKFWDQKGAFALSQMLLVTHTNIYIKRERERN